MKFLQNLSFLLFPYSGKMQTRCKQFFKTQCYVSHRPELLKQIRSLILICIFTFKNLYYWLCWMPWLLENHYGSQDGFLLALYQFEAQEWHDVNADGGYACVKWYEERGRFASNRQFPNVICLALTRKRETHTLERHFAPDLWLLAGTSFAHLASPFQACHVVGPLALKYHTYS